MSNGARGLDLVGPIAQYLRSLGNSYGARHTCYDGSKNAGKMARKFFAWDSYERVVSGHVDFDIFHFRHRLSSKSGNGFELGLARSAMGGPVNFDCGVVSLGDPLDIGHRDFWVSSLMVIVGYIVAVARSAARINGLGLAIAIWMIDHLMTPPADCPRGAGYLKSTTSRKGCQ